MNIRIKQFIVFFCFFSGFVFSQTDTTQIKKRVYTDNYFRYNFDNDVFCGTDRYYTQGVYIDLILRKIIKSPLSKILIPLSKNSLNYYGISVEHDVFTPKEIWDGDVEKERPYAGVFFISQFLTSINTEKKQRLNTRIDLGIMGPGVEGEKGQQVLHKWTDNVQPKGWDDQIATDYVINYDIKFEQGLLTKNNIELIGFTGARLGTLYDDIGVGTMVRVGWMDSYFKNIGVVKKQKNSENKTKKFQCYIFTRGKVKAVGYNAMLQGGVISRKSVYTTPSEDVKRYVGDIEGGIAMAFKQLSIEYSKICLSSEFKGGLSHSWGHFGMTLCF